MNCISVVDIDELAVQALTWQNKSKQLHHFYGQFINSFKDLKAIEVKNNIIDVVYNKKEFEDFVTQECFI